MAFIGPGFLYVHMPKTGGTTTSVVLRELYGAASLRHAHEPVSSCSYTERAGRLVFGTVRNPLRWYPSLWRHASANGSARECMRLYGRGSLEFRDVLYGWTHPAECPEIPRQRVTCLNNAMSRADVSLQTSGHGLATWTTLYTYGGRYPRQGEALAWDVDALIPTDRLTEGLSRLLGRDVSAFGRHNEGDVRDTRVPSDDYADWYDTESYGWVLEADRPLFDAFGWDGCSVSPTALWHVPDWTEVARRQIVHWPTEAVA